MMQYGTVVAVWRNMVRFVAIWRIWAAAAVWLNMVWFVHMAQYGAVVSDGTIRYSMLQYGIRRHL